MKKSIADAVTMKKAKAYSPPAPPPPIQKGQIVFVTVLPKADIAGNYSDCSPKLFATREAAQADCDGLNKTRNKASQFVIREMEVN